jgi:hypothetical protein
MRSTRPLSSTTAARHCSGTTPSSGTVSAGSKKVQRLLQVSLEQVDRVHRGPVGGVVALQLQRL